MVAVHLCLAVTKQVEFSINRTQTFMTFICRPMELESPMAFLYPSSHFVLEQALVFKWSVVL